MFSKPIFAYSLAQTDRELQPTATYLALSAQYRGGNFRAHFFRSSYRNDTNCFTNLRCFLYSIYRLQQHRSWLSAIVSWHFTWKRNNFKEHQLKNCSFCHSCNSCRWVGSIKFWGKREGGRLGPPRPPWIPALHALNEDLVLVPENSNFHQSWQL